MGSVDELGFAGVALTKKPTIVGPRKTPQDIAVPAVSYPLRLRDGVAVQHVVDVRDRVFIASGQALPTKMPQGKVIHLPYTELLNADGRPKEAEEIWTRLAKACVPRYAEIVLVSDDPGEAAANYFLLKLMGYPDVRIALA